MEEQLKLELQLFGGFNLYSKEKVYPLEDLLGRQLSSLFALIVLGYGKVVNKEYLINKLWQDSENPVNALKYAIYRLRASLKKIDELADIELVQTLKNGYQINMDAISHLDVMEFSQLYADRSNGTEYESLMKMFELYKGHLLNNVDGEWVDGIREHYYRQFLFVCEQLCIYELEKKHPNQVIHITQKVFENDEYNELFNGYYLKALILNNQYNAALKHYDALSKKFLQEFGYAMTNEDNELFKIISSNSENEERKNIHELASSLADSDLELGAFFSEYISFKKMYQFELRNSLRTQQGSYFVLFEIRCPKAKMDKVMRYFLGVIAETLRINDVYTQINQSQVGLMLKLQNEQDAFIVIERLMGKLYKKFNADSVKLNYHVTNILKEAQENIRVIKSGKELELISFKS